MTLGQYFTALVARYLRIPNDVYAGLDERLLLWSVYMSHCYFLESATIYRLDTSRLLMLSDLIPYHDSCD